MTAKKTATKKTAKSEKSTAAVRGFKGFDKDMKCRGMQYEVGKTFTVEGEPKLCERGLHFCEYPLDVFGYYAPAESRFCDVNTDCASPEKHDDDSKRVSSSLTVGVEVGIPGIVKAAIEYTMSRVKDTGKISNSGDYGAASTSGADSCAFSAGYGSKVKGELGCGICCVERDAAGKLLAIKAALVDGAMIKPGTWYTVRGGEFVEVAA